MPQGRELPSQQFHLTARMDRMEQDARHEMWLLTGREMLRAICVWVSYRSERGQHFNCKGLLKTVIDKQRPDGDLFYFYNEWMAVYRDMRGCSAPSPEMTASSHEHIYEQMKLLLNMQHVLNFYDMSSDKIGTGIRAYPWLLDHLHKMVDRERDNFSIDTCVMTLNQRGSWERKKNANAAAVATGGGKAAVSAAVAAVVPRTWAGPQTSRMGA